MAGYSHALSNTPQAGSQLDATDRRIIVATQAGLPLVPAPYDTLADQLGLDVEELIARISAMQENGIIRRIAAVPNHYALGYTPRHLPMWPYNLFAMVHGHTRQDVEEKIVVIAGLLGNYCRGQEVLYSKRILKKTGLRISG
jgi:DNA-binding Lrp family transcriptional regulator